MTLEEKVVKQKELDENYYSERKNTVFNHIDETLVKLDILPLVLHCQPYCPELISQFYCTIHFKQDQVRTMVWMCGGDRKIRSNLAEFSTSLGCTWINIHGNHGYRIHDHNEYAKESLPHFYPPEVTTPNLPFISEMYPFYNLLANIFRASIMSKAGDISAIRGYMNNLMYILQA